MNRHYSESKLRVIRIAAYHANLLDRYWCREAEPQADENKAYTVSEGYTVSTSQPAAARWVDPTPLQGASLD